MATRKMYRAGTQARPLGLCPVGESGETSIERLILALRSRWTRERVPAIELDKIGSEIMGREIKRVPLDFSWPLHKVWEGFLMPESLHLPECPDCRGDGYSVEARAISKTFYAHQIGGHNAEALAWHNKIGQAEVDHLVAEGRLSVLRKRQPTDDNPRDWELVSEPRSAAEINAENTRGGMNGHDGINRMLLVSFRCERLGINT